MTYQWDAYTSIGGRKNNEDAVAVLEGARGVLLLVADGLGGHDCGEAASALTIETIRCRFADVTRPFDLSEALCEANTAVRAKQRESGLQMKTTVCAAWLCGDKTVFAHVGDSRIYAFFDRQVVFESLDHSASQMAVLLGEITRDDIRTHADRSVLTRAIGGAEQVKPDVTVLSTDAYDALLLCTDGFWEYVLEREMGVLQAAGNGAKGWLTAMRALHASRVPPKHDNNSAIVLMK